ncbi:PP-loop family-domain-containing protein [Phlebopus sp. FC_14]|nr:PP-loop family-domain-containing protein [Phlebopus sp. FC_14]
MTPVSPILLSEFLTAFTKCTPPSGWPTPSKIAVANSAGPDSTCLLFLLAKLVAHPETNLARKTLPTSLVSFYVDHKLQPASSDMAAKASSNAALLGVEHLNLEIPWGVPPFPPRPLNGALEQISREARYHVLFHAMTRAGVATVAFGHHADDQIETALMRLVRGSTLAGAAGMRRCRRWGMGSESSEDALGWFGHRGMDRYIVRPFLDFGKDRILATCDAYGLDYFNDPTNFQPALTLRNAIRHTLSTGDLLNSIDLARLPKDISEPMTKVKDAASYLESLVTGVNGIKERLRCATKVLSERLEVVDREVTRQLKHVVRPSPPGTIRLSTSKLSEVTDPDVRRAMVWRVMRYVSLYPWGSTGAESFRRQSSIEQVMSSLWMSKPQEVKRFTAGGGVLWAPMLPKSSKRPGGGDHRLQHPREITWLVSRMPPFSRNPQAGVGSASRLIVDLTEKLAAAVKSEKSLGPIEVLYDCRFLVRFDLSQMPREVETSFNNRETILSVKILPVMPHYLPSVVLQQASRPDQVLAILTDQGTMDTMGFSPWISIEWARSLEAI